MAIDKSAPDIWQPLIDKIAELVGKEFEPIYEDNYWKFYKGTRPSIPEEWLVETAIDRVTGKMRMIMPDEVYEKIYNHPLLDKYLDDLSSLVEKERLSLPRIYELQVYVSPSQELSAVGMRQSDFL